MDNNILKSAISKLKMAGANIVLGNDFGIMVKQKGNDSSAYILYKISTQQNKILTIPVAITDFRLFRHFITFTNINSIGVPKTSLYIKDKDEDILARHRHAVISIPFMESEIIRAYSNSFSTLINKNGKRLSLRALANKLGVSNLSAYLDQNKGVIYITLTRGIVTDDLKAADYIVEVYGEASLDLKLKLYKHPIEMDILKYISI